MRFLRNVSALVAATIVSGTAANAYTLDQAAKPAEYPPASFAGDVYVDSRGCAYVRASIGSQTNWVPRLNSDRTTVVCGLTPTSRYAAAPTGRPPAPPAPPPPPPVDTPPERAMDDAPAAQTRTAQAPEPAGEAAITRTMTVTCPTDGSTARVRIGRDTVAIQCAPNQTTAKSYIVRHANGERTRLIAQPAPATRAPATVARTPAPAPAAPTGQTTSSGRVVIGGTPPGAAPQQGGYPFGNGYGLTSGPGAVDPVPSPSSAPIGSPSAAVTTGTSYSVPTVATTPQIPEGYRAAWDDDRLNPNRGPRTTTGDMQMAARWDVSKLPMRENNQTPAQGLIAQPSTGVHLFTKSPATEPVAAPAPAPAELTHRYVQVGMFNVPENAERAAAKLQALGLPGRVAKTRSGRTVVVAGPYDSASALNAALTKARQGGFSDAFLRS